MLINISNHPSDKWSEKQRMAAAVYGEILDIPFPQIPPEKGERYIHDLAEKYASIIENDLVHPDNNAVHIIDFKRNNLHRINNGNNRPRYIRQQA